MPAVSVVLPVYNGERFLAETLNSILDQSFRDFEVIIVDDGSTDRTPTILEDFANRDRRVRFIRQNNRGITPSLNRGLELSTGEYIARADSDDLSEPLRLEKQKTYLDAHPKTVAVGTHALRITPERWPIDIYMTPGDHEQIDGRHINGFAGQLLHATAMIRSETLESIGGYCEDFPVAQDVDILLRLAEVGLLANLEMPLTQVRLSIGSISDQRRIEQIKLTVEAVSRARRRRGLPPLEKFPSLWFPKNEVDFILDWVRKAIVAKNFMTARHYAWKAFKIKPNPYIFKLLMYSVLAELGLK